MTVGSDTSKNPEITFELSTFAVDFLSPDSATIINAIEDVASLFEHLKGGGRLVVRSQRYSANSQPSLVHRELTEALATMNAQLRDALSSCNSVLRMCMIEEEAHARDKTRSTDTEPFARVTLKTMKGESNSSSKLVSLTTGSLNVELLISRSWSQICRLRSGSKYLISRRFTIRETIKRQSAHAQSDRKPVLPLFDIKRYIHRRQQ